MALQIDERSYNLDQKRQHYSLLSQIEKIRQHHMFQPGPSNRQAEYPDFNFNPSQRATTPVRASSPPRPSTPPPFAIPIQNHSRDTESIENEVDNQEPDSSTYQSGSRNTTQRSHAFGSGLRNVFPTSSSAVQDLPTRDTITLSQSNAQFQDKIIMELCKSKYDHIPRDSKMNLIEEIMLENETQFMESQLTVESFLKIFLQRYELEQSRRQRTEFLVLKRGLATRETYSRIIRKKKDSKSNTSLNQK